ncbi:MAG: ATP-dependent Clp protease ATP-binding subunit [Chloroflexi bacterium]|nr:ATP-dependent Clp protease ATP-binding subunit [Chloroflexota bacterium]
MSTLNRDLLDATTRQILNRASDLMRTQGRALLTPELALIALLRMSQATAARMVQHFAVQRGFVVADLEREADEQSRTRPGRSANFTYMTDQNVPAPLSDEMLVVLDEARAVALARGEIYIGSEDVLSALAQTGVNTAGMLQRRGVTAAAISALAEQGLVSKSTTTHDWVAAARKGALQPVYLREQLLQQLSMLLAHVNGRNVFLIGVKGVGRRSLVQGLAFAIAEGRGPRDIARIIEVSEAAWLDNPLLAMQVALRQAEGGALFIPNVQRFFGRAETQAMAQASRELQRAIVDGGAIVIGTTSDVEFNERIRPISAIADRIKLLSIPPASADECVGMLRVLDPQLERDYELVIQDEALVTAQQLAARYVGGEPLPAAAVQVLHRACALKRSGAATSPAPLIVDQDAVMQAVSALTGVPVNKLGADERAKYAQIDDALRQRVLGQDEAVRALARAVKSARVGLKDPKRPIGSFLFLGPSGVGKTELAKALAEFLFGSEDALVAIDMSEYQKDDTINRLIGAPPGYVGYEGGGQLTERILKSPYAVVVFDEVEKAHPRILDILLQVMEEGRLTDGQGRVANFAETVLILTSNLGAQFLNDAALELVQANDLAMVDVRGFFRPEFLNRLDDIVMFRPLSPEVLRRVLDLMIVKEAKLAAARGIALQITPIAREWLLAQNNEPHMGARPLRRILQRNVREKLADFLLDQAAPPAQVVVDVAAGVLVFR